MTPTRRLQHMLVETISPLLRGVIDLPNIDHAQGFYKQHRADVMPWTGDFSFGRHTYTLGSWDTVRECVRFGVFVADCRGVLLSYANFEVSADRPRVLNKRTQVIPSGAVYCGRGSPYGNPFKIGDMWRGKRMTRDMVCDRFEVEVLPDLDIRKLRGKHLVCYCAPLRCHCHSILRKANSR